MENQSVAITGGRVVPVTADPIENGTVLIEDGRITAAGRDVPVPPGIRVVDAGGGWVLPGFIDAHTHLGVAVFSRVERAFIGGAEIYAWAGGEAVFTGP